MNGIRILENDTRIYYCSDLLGWKSDFNLGYALDQLHLNVDEEGVTVISLLHAFGYGEHATQLAAQAGDWRFMTEKEIEWYELNMARSEIVGASPSDFQQSLVEAETLKGLVANLDGHERPAFLAGATTVSFTPEIKSFVKELMDRDDSCWTFAKAGELKAAGPYPDYSMPELSTLEAKHARAFEVALSDAQVKFCADIMTSTGKLMSLDLRGFAMFLAMGQAAQMHLNICVRRPDQAQNLDEFLEHAAHAWELTHRMMNDTGATS